MRRGNDDPRHRLSGPGAPTSKADHAYETILQSILDGEYEPGDRLVIERLARELGVSVVPVREAIRRLESDGYVTFTRNVGATVTSIDLDRYPETIEAVAALEGVALGLAVPHLTATDLRRAREVNDRLRESLVKFDPTQFTRLNRRFHEILFGACPNRHILAILEREWALLDTTRRSAFTYIPERAARSVAGARRTARHDRERPQRQRDRALRPRPPDEHRAHGCSSTSATTMGHGRRLDRRRRRRPMRFRSDPAAVRGSIAPIVTPFTADGEVDHDGIRAPRAVAARRPARTASRSAARPASRARRPSPNGSPRCGSWPRRSPTGCRSCPAPARPSSTRPSSSRRRRSTSAPTSPW